MSKLMMAPLMVVLLIHVTSAFRMEYDSGFFPEEDNYDSLSAGGGESRDVLNVDKRYGLSYACRRCMFRRDDWRSCSLCYNRPGPVPFYGGYNKRSSPDDTASYTTGAGSFPAGIAPGEYSMNPYVGEAFQPFTKEKRGAGLDQCRCCLASPATNRDCCNRCNFTPFYAQKRGGYMTSFVPLSVSGGAGMCDICCESDTFDFYCCMFSCGDKRRK